MQRLFSSALDISDEIAIFVCEHPKFDKKKCIRGLNNSIDYYLSSLIESEEFNEGTSLACSNAIRQRDWLVATLPKDVKEIKKNKKDP